MYLKNFRHTTEDGASFYEDGHEYTIVANTPAKHAWLSDYNIADLSLPEGIFTLRGRLSTILSAGVAQIVLVWWESTDPWSLLSTEVVAELTGEDSKQWEYVGLIPEGAVALRIDYRLWNSTGTAVYDGTEMLTGDQSRPVPEWEPSAEMEVVLYVSPEIAWNIRAGEKTVHITKVYREGIDGYEADSEG